MRCSKEGKRRGMRGQQREWRKGFKGLEGRRDRVSDGVGQARLDLGSSFGFLGAGPTGGRWMWAERWDHRQHDHVSREALHLARLLRSLPRVDSLGTNFTLMGVLFLSPPLPEAAWGMARALLQRKLAAARARLRRKFPRRVPDGVRSAAKAADGGSQPRWTWWRALRRLQRALVPLNESPQYGKLLLKLQSRAISSRLCVFRPPQARG